MSRVSAEEGITVGMTRESLTTVSDMCKVDHGVRCVGHAWAGHEGLSQAHTLPAQGTGRA